MQVQFGGLPLQSRVGRRFGVRDKHKKWQFIPVYEFHVLTEILDATKAAITITEVG